MLVETEIYSSIVYQNGDKTADVIYVESQTVVFVVPAVAVACAVDVFASVGADLSDFPLLQWLTQ